MQRVVLAVLALAVAGVHPLLAEGTTPPGPWLPVIKDAIREKLMNPQYVTFRRIFFVDKKTDDGSLPVCGFVSFKQKKEEHPAKQSFFGLLTPPDAGKAGSFGAIQMGGTAAQTDEIAKICKNYGVY